VSPPADPRSVRTVYLLTAAGTAVWLAAVFAAPWLAGRGAFGAARFLYSVFSPVCHQIPSRCFVLQGYPLAVCGRCLGIYAGFAAGLALYPFVRGFSRPALPKALTLLLMTGPIALDATAGIAGVWSSPIAVRFATGFVWGILLPFYFIAGVSDFLATRKVRAAARALEKPGPKKVE
jgi:uncharacterized membrane protein